MHDCSKGYVRMYVFVEPHGNVHSKLCIVQTVDKQQGMYIHTFVPLPIIQGLSRRSYIFMYGRCMMLRSYLCKH